MYAEQQLQAQEPVPNTLLAQAHEATSAGAYIQNLKLGCVLASQQRENLE